MIFSDQVESLTGITISASNTHPTNDQLTQFLTDGAKDVINKLQKTSPQLLELFSTTSTDSNNSGVAVQTGNVLSVYRADGVNASNLEPAARISSRDKYRATDTDSLSFRSNFNPGYYIENGTVYIVPAPSNSTTNKGVVNYIAFPTVAHGDSGIGTTYTSISGVTATAADPTVFSKAGHELSDGDIVKLSGFNEMTEINGMTGTVNQLDSGTFEVNGVSADPAETTGGLVEKISTGFPDEYEHLVVLYASIRSLHTAMVNVITDLSSFSATAVPPNFADSYTSSTTNVPSANSGENIENEIAQMQDYIEVNEDVELANAKSSELDARFKLAMDKFQSGLQKYREESAGYSQEINAEITEEAQKVQTEAARYQWYQDRFTALQAEYLGAFAVPQQAEQQGARR